VSSEGEAGDLCRLGLRWPVPRRRDDSFLIARFEVSLVEL
jgi:hypothetical protein